MKTEIILHSNKMIIISEVMLFSPNGNIIRLKGKIERQSINIAVGFFNNTNHHIF